MHIADFCVTDTKSAIAVARALGRSYFICPVDEWHVRRNVSRKIRFGHHILYRDLDSDLIILCGCDSATCQQARQAYLKHEEEKAKCVG